MAPKRCGRRCCPATTAGDCDARAARGCAWRPYHRRAKVSGCYITRTKPRSKALRSKPRRVLPSKRPRGAVPPLEELTVAEAVTLMARRMTPAMARSLLSVSGTRKGTLDHIRRRYLALAVQFHPDKGGQGDLFALLQRAYERLVPPAPPAS